MSQVDRSGTGALSGNAVRPGSSSGRAAITAAAGVGVLAGLVGAALAALLNQGKSTVRAIEQGAVDAAVIAGVVLAGEYDHTLASKLPVPRADGIYLPDGSIQPEAADLDGFGLPRPLVLAMLGDSTSVGFGARSADEVPGVRLAKGIAAQLHRRVRLSTHGLNGAGASDLSRQLAEAVPGGPDIVVILVGANDIRDKVPPHRSADHLGEAVAALRSEGIPVVVGTCPDFGVIEPIPQPLRALLHTWSMLLATLQERAVLAAGGRSVPIGRLVSPGFAHHPELFAGDRFHPSGAGYARAVDTLLPVAIEEIRGSAAAAAIDGIVA